MGYQLYCLMECVKDDNGDLLQGGVCALCGVQSSAQAVQGRCASLPSLALRAGDAHGRTRLPVRAQTLGGHQGRVADLKAIVADKRGSGMWLTEIT